MYCAIIRGLKKHSTVILTKGKNKTVKIKGSVIYFTLHKFGD